MKKILLVCAAGMSTSMLVKKMKESADKRSIAVEINALSMAEAKEKIAKEGVDIVLLGPQVRFQRKEIEDVVKGKIPVDVIDMKSYGMMDGESVLNTALSQI
ncbi:MAG: PTS system cellobiose-specific EIIB component [Candidatus Erwinia impunctatus]|nr:PTS system cellobiose-specific EIIB component [Culicoides impunctatus]